MNSKPNILWITTDQQRYDTIRNLGNPYIVTPNLDKLCKEGVAFSKAYSQSPVCTPSRASFLTGLYPSALHVNQNGIDYFPSKFKLITRRLSDIGYDCGLSGKLHLTSAWNRKERRTDDGYRVFHFSHSPAHGMWKGNEYIDWLVERGVNPHDILRWDEKRNRFFGYNPDVQVELHQTTWCVDKAIEFIDEKRDSPWMMSVNIFDPHPPFDAPKIYRDMYDAKSLPPPIFRESDLVNQEKLKTIFHQTQPPIRPTNQIQEYKASYYGMISLIDEQVGRLLAFLEKNEQRKNTIVIYNSDHGEMLGDHGLMRKGCRFYEGAVHIPLIISWPEKFKEGLICDELVELTDITPTLAEAAGIQLELTHGKSLIPILKRELPPKTHRDSVLCEYYDALNLEYYDIANLRKPSYKKIQKPPYGTMYFDGHYKLIVYHESDLGELYDHQIDPEECDNLWDCSTMTSLKLDLIKKSYDKKMLISDPESPPIVGRY
jgi:arylsulfatase